MPTPASNAWLVLEANKPSNELRYANARRTWLYICQYRSLELSCRADDRLISALVGGAVCENHVKPSYMSWKQGRGERGYHHGNLKEALIRAALDLIAQKGAAGFTFAEAARWAGVSAAAPYRHFRDRDDLIAGVALKGFELFTAALEHAWAAGRPDPDTAFKRLGRAYLDFARREPAYYSAMFEAGISLDANPELRAAGDKAFGILRGATDGIIAAMPAGSRPPGLMMALHVWALSHGIASLFARGDPGRRTVPMPAEDLLEAAMLIYLRGLTAPKGNGEPG